jgi:GNAT superfamily N-acetyltransferase
MECKIIPISEKKDIKKFVKAQWLFYKNNPNFVPPIIAEEVKLFDRNINPLYKHCDYQLFLAESNGNILGRIAAIENKQHNLIHKDKIGFFGFFECIDDQNVANALFDATKKWLQERGLNIMRGPTNPTFNDVIGFLVEGFGSPAVTLSPYTPEYYLKLSENYGFHKAKDLYAYKLVYESYRSEKLTRLHNLIQERTKAVIREVNFKDKEQLAKDVKTMKELYNAAWQPNWGFVKMTDAEFDYLAKQLVPVGVSELTLMLEIKGKPVAFALCLPDINQQLIYNKKGSYIGAGIQLMTKKKKVDTVRIIVLGVMPEYQKTGVDVLLYYYIGEAAKKLGYRYGDASWILEDNVMMTRGLTQTMHAKKYKTFRIYDIEI